MAYDKGTVSRRVLKWAENVEQFQPPQWEQLPGLELYMDQVIILLKQYLGPLLRNEEKAVTASIINNYVRMKLMPPPVKKKYSRVHIAYLLMICILKQSLSISCIRRLLPEEHGEEAVRDLYESFAGQYRTVASAFIQHIHGEVGGALPAGADLVTAAAVFATLSKDLTEFLLEPEDEAEPVSAAK